MNPWTIILPWLFIAGCVAIGGVLAIITKDEEI